jgi:hypothetical protein
MQSELDVLGDVSTRLEALGLPFMLTGSFALAFYATPRMTRDLDIVVAVDAERIAELTESFASDYFVDSDMIRAAIDAKTLFNLMHFGTGLKVDLIVRKSSAYRMLEFSRRRQVQFGTIRTWIVSAEDLILSKLVWAQESNSEMQLRDVKLLLTGPLDVDYLRTWARELGVASRLDALLT